MSRRGPRSARGSRSEAGYALLFAVFLAASMFILASVVAPSILNNGRRQREQELIWRGNQYVRGIRLYFQKNGRLPQNKEELVKGTLDVHFVRKPFADPVGPRSADWRFIYVAPSGQLTGSVRYHTLQEMAAAQGGGPNAQGLAALLGGSPAGPQGGTAGAPGSAATAGRGGQGGAGAGAAGARGGALGGARGGVGGPGTGAAGQVGGGSQTGGPTPVPLGAVDGPVFGASLVGVASKVKQESLLVYQGKDTYFEWEFIWNPLLGGPGGAQLPVTASPPGSAPIGPGTEAGNPPPFGGPGTGQQGPRQGPGQLPVPGMPGVGRQ